MKMMVYSVMLMSAWAMFPSSLSAQNAMNLNIVNQSGYPDDQVYFIMICQSPLGYLDFRNHVIVPTPTFSLDVMTMVATLAQLKEYSGDGTCSIPCPAMGSSRVYFCLGQNFDQMGGFAASGPEMGTSNPVPWGMFEVNLSGGKFVNQSNVDFFSIAYTLTVGALTVGIPAASETIFSDFEAISLSDSSQQNGNTAVFKSLIIKNPAGEVIRVISPKAAALGWVNSGTLPQMFTHFLDDYVNTYCWKPGRTFSFSSKLASDTATYYGRVSADGLTLSIYTDAAMTIPYTVSSLPRPSNDWGSPDFANRAYLWHNVGVTSTAPGDIDWGYLIYGQDGYASGPGAYWITDPVAMAIPVSIVRGVMHMDNGTVDWKDSSKYYKGVNGASTSAFPIFYYGKILHQYGIAGRVYALSFDDVYGNDSGIGFTDPAVTMTIYPFKTAATAVEPCQGDFDGDAKADPAVYDDQTGRWSVKLSQENYTRVDLSGFLGSPGSQAAQADYDGDAKADPAVYMETNPSTGLTSSPQAGSGQAGVWSVKLSSGNYSQLTLPGFLGDIGWEPVAADYDGDRLADPAVYQENTGNWQIKLSSAGYGLMELNGFAGGTGYSAVAADFDGDRLADPTLYNRADGTWIVRFSAAGYVPLVLTGLLGGAGALPAPGDYDGDMIADPAVMEPMTGDWSVLLSSGNYVRVDLTGFLGGI
jgi:hypothetical protein